MKLNARKIATIAGGTFVAASIALFALYVVLTWREAKENRFSNYTEARGSQSRGWLPKMLPLSATEIHEWHDLDTNVSFGSFRFDSRQRSAIEVMLRPGLGRPLRIDRDPSFASTLPRDPSEEQLARAGFEFYKDQDFAFAISWNAGIAYFWNSAS
jgi:hypothetical protein